MKIQSKNTLYQRNRRGWHFVVIALLLFGVYLALGWLTAYGVARGWYAGVWSNVLTATATVVVAIAVLWWMLRQSESKQGKGWQITTKEMQEQQAAIEELRRSNALLHTILASTTDLIWVKDAAGRITLGNQATYNLLGGGEADRVLGRSADELVPNPEQAEQIKANDARVMTQGQAETLEESLDDPVQPLVFQTVKAPLRDATGQIVGIVGISRDITERKLSEERLRERTRQLDLLARISRLLILGEQTEAQLLESVFGEVAQTIGAEMYFNYQPNDDVSMRLSTWGGLTNDERAQFATMRYGDLLCGRVAERRQPIIVEDIANNFVEGSEAVRAAHYGAYAGFPLLADGRLVGTVAFVTRHKKHFAEGEVQTIQTVCDQVATTLERRRLTTELHASEQRMRAVFDQQFQFMAVLAPDGTLLEVNDLPIKTTGVTREQVIGRKFWETVWWEPLPAIRDRWPERLNEAAHADGPVLSRDAYAMADGDVHQATCTVTAVKDNTGRVELFIVQAIDVTESQQSEAALRASESRYRAFVQASAHIVWQSDADGAFTQEQASWQEFTGQTWDEYRENGWLNALHPDDRARVAAAWQQALVHRSLYEIEERIRHHDGKYRWVQVRAVPILNESGVLLEWVGTTTDITTRKEAEEKLRTSEQRFRLATETSHIGIWEWNVLTNEIQWDAQMFAIYGIEPTADGVVQFATWRAAILTEDVAEQESILQATVNQGGSKRRAFRIRRFSDGEVRYIEAVETVRTNSEGKTEWLVGTNIDITDRKQADRRQAQLSATLNSFVTSAPLGLSYVDREFRYVLINDYLAQLNGLPAAEHIGKTLAEVLGNHWPVFEPLYSRVLETGETITNYEFTGEQALQPGVVRTASANFFPLILDDEIIGVGFSVVDITTRKEAEAALVEAHHQLSQERQRLALALTTGGLGAYEWQVESDLLWWSPETYVLFGVEPETFTPTIAAFDAMIHPDDRAELWRKSDESLRRKQVFQHEYRIIRPDGAVRWITNHSYVQAIASGSLRVTGIAADITERKQTEETLRESEARLRLALESSFTIAFTWDVRRDIVRRYYSSDPVLGNTDDTHTNSFEETVNFIHPDDRALFRHNVQAALDDPAGKYQSEYRILHPDGTTRWYAERGQVEHAPDSTPLRLVGLSMDITERKQAEEMLRLSEERLHQLHAIVSHPALNDAARLRALLQLGCDAFQLGTGVVGEVADEWYKVAAAQSPGDTLPVGFTCPLSDALCDEVLKHNDLLAIENVGSSEWAGHRALAIFGTQVYFGVPLWVSGRIFGTLCFTGSSPRAQIFTRSDHEFLRLLAQTIGAEMTRQQFTDALRQSETRLQLGVDVAEFALAEIDYTTNTNHLTAQAARLYGLGREPMIVQREQVHATFHQDDRARLNKLIEECLHPTGTGWFAGEHRVVWPDGTVRWLNVRKRVFFDEARQRPMRALLAAQDITARKEVELAREQLLVREQHARELADDANRAKDEWVAMVSHELRTPLNPILGQARLLNLRRNQLAPELLKFTDLVLRNGERQNELINDLLDTARISTGKLRLEPVPVDLTTIITEALETVRASAQAKSVRLLPQLTPVGIMNGDAKRLQQVVWNLLSNAVKFTPAGGHIIINLQRTAEQVVVTVRDTGAGIAPEFLPHVFERFSQQDTSRSRRYGGLGLGLALVKQIIELHGGTIKADSDGVGCGAMFTVHLPIQSSRPAEVGERKTDCESPAIASFHIDENLPSLDGVQVLLVEDDADAQVLVESVLVAQGATVQSVQTAAAAWPLLTHAARPDIVICDIGLPEEDGYSLLQRLRQWEQEHKREAIPALALTALSGLHDRLQALQAGYQIHIVKPLDPQELLLVLQSLRDRRQRVSQDVARNVQPMDGAGLLDH